MEVAAIGSDVLVNQPPTFQKKKKSPDFIVFADFQGVNNLIIVTFQLVLTALKTPQYLTICKYLFFSSL